jgi:hypothetical protein
MAISEENGVEAYKIYDSPICSSTFCEIFKDIDDAHGAQWHGFADSGSWHKSKYTNRMLMERGTKLSINLVAQPR